MFRESNVRSFVKMLSWRVCATLSTVVIVYVFVGKVNIAAMVGGVEVVVKMALYYIHERGWDKIRFGRHQVRPFVIWFTGLPSSGKSTLARRVYEFLQKSGHKVERLDGDAIRAVFPETGFSREERNRHIRKAGFLASLLERNGVIVVASFVSPYKESREFARSLCKNFIEIYVSTPVEECERRDVKGLYKKARAGVIKNFTGISDPYEVPEAPQLVIDTLNQTVDGSFGQIKRYIAKYLA